jgi:sugar-specific transcriptional regulator TrmB
MELFEEELEAQEAEEEWAGNEEAAEEFDDMIWALEAEIAAAKAGER